MCLFLVCCIAPLRLLDEALTCCRFNVWLIAFLFHILCALPLFFHSLIHFSFYVSSFMSLIFFFISFLDFFLLFVIFDVQKKIGSKETRGVRNIIGCNTTCVTFSNAAPALEATGHDWRCDWTKWRACCHVD